MTTLENQDTDDVQEIDNSYWSKQYQALESLKNKQFFKTLIEEGYFKDYALSLIMELIDPSVVAEGRRGAVMEKMVGLARLQDYLNTVKGLSTTQESYEQDYSEFVAKESNRLDGLNKALITAQNDPDFKVLFTDGYLNDFVLNQTSLLSNDNVIRSGKRTEVLEALSGTSVFNNYLIDLQKGYADMVMASQVEEEE